MSEEYKQALVIEQREEIERLEVKVLKLKEEKTELSDDLRENMVQFITLEGKIAELETENTQLKKENKKLEK